MGKWLGQSRKRTHRESYKDRAGYYHVYYPQHPRADRQGFLYEHIKIWEEHNGMPVPDGYVIHHLNGHKGDNRPGNLVALPHKAHNNALVVKALRSKIRELEAKLSQKKLSFGADVSSES